MPTDATTRDGDGLAKVDNRAPDPETLAPHLLRRRNRIVTAAIELLEDGEYDEIQIRDVAHQAGVALGTLYRYFTSKEHLYAAALLEWARSFELKSIAGRPSRVSPTRTGSGPSWPARSRRSSDGPRCSAPRSPSRRRPIPNARAIFDEFSRRHISVMTGALVDTPEDTAEAMVGMTNNVMASQLRAWALGRISIGDVRRCPRRDGRPRSSHPLPDPPAARRAWTRRRDRRRRTAAETDGTRDGGGERDRPSRRGALGTAGRNGSPRSIVTRRGSTGSGIWPSSPICRSRRRFRTSSPRSGRASVRSASSPTWPASRSLAPFGTTTTTRRTRRR